MSKGLRHDFMIFEFKLDILSFMIKVKIKASPNHKMKPVVLWNIVFWAIKK